MSFSMKDLLMRQVEVRKEQPEYATPTQPSTPIETGNVTRILEQAAKSDEARLKAEAAARERFEAAEFDRADDDGMYVPYVESRDLVPVNLPVLHEGIEEADIDYGNFEDDPYESDYYADDDTDFAFDDIMAGVKITPDPSQEAAVRELSAVQYGCLIGAAGTGKTTTTRLLLNTLINGDAAFDIEPLRLARVNLRAYNASTNEAGEEGEAIKDLIPAIAFCAYTGQATQVLKSRMPGSWQKNVFTIHSLLGFYPEAYTKADGKDSMRFVPFYTKDNKMPWDVYFIDEASMVSVDLWHMMLDAMKPGARVYMIGDLNQLPPPVGQGILGFALAKWKVCELTVVHRQSDEGANRIVDTAHSILRGKKFEFDDPRTNKEWRVIGMKLEHETSKAYAQVINLCKQLSTKYMPDGDRVYDPWRDRVMTQMNGFDENTSQSLVGQHPINEALSQIFADPTQPRIVIDAKREQKRFSVGYRVMATKNESPAEVNRVTNGMTGIILSISENPKWVGDRRLVGEESIVKTNRTKMLQEAMEHRGKTTLDLANEASHALDSFELNHDLNDDSVDRNGGPASHIVEVRFDNGALRRYTMNAQVEQLRIAYASTTHKAQGAEMPTAIIVVHHASKQMLSRENLYTAVTRATKRVIMLYSEHGLNIALATQKITGVTLAQKLKQYERMLGEGESSGGFKLYNVRLSEND